MKFDLLAQALNSNKDIISPNFLLPLNISSLSSFEQRMFLDEIFKEGTFICKIRVPDKSTECPTATFTWQGDGCYLQLGHANLPAQRASSKSKDRLYNSPDTLIKSVDEESLLVYENKTLLKYSLSKISHICHIFLENGSWNKKANEALPEKYNTIEKVLTLLQYPYEKIT